MIILFGPAGSGKTTQGRLLADKYFIEQPKIIRRRKRK